MSTDAIELLFGAGLLVAAILGGGFTVKEINIPPLKPVARVLCSMLGALLVLASLKLIPPTTSIAKAGPSIHCRNARSTGGPLSGPAVQITDRLGTDQKYERIDIAISGNGVGTLCVEEGSEDSSLSSIWIPLTSRQETWSATGSEETTLSSGDRTRSIRGEGAIDLQHPGRYSIRTQDSTEAVENIRLTAY
jgi:hypothetical protein